MMHDLTQTFGASSRFCPLGSKILTKRSNKYAYNLTSIFINFILLQYLQYSDKKVKEMSYQDDPVFCKLGDILVEIQIEKVGSYAHFKKLLKLTKRHMAEMEKNKNKFLTDEQITQCFLKHEKAMDAMLKKWGIDKKSPAYMDCHRRSTMNVIATLVYLHARYLHDPEAVDHMVTLLSKLAANLLDSLEEFQRTNM